MLLAELGVVWWQRIGRLVWGIFSNPAFSCIVVAMTYNLALADTSRDEWGQVHTSAGW